MSTISKIVVVFICFHFSLTAGTITWDDGAADQNFNNPINWTGDVSPTNNDVATIGSSYSVNVTAPMTIGGLTLGASNGSTVANLYIPAGSNLLIAGLRDAVNNDFYRDSSGNIFVTGGNLVLRNPTTTNVNNRWGHRNGSSDNITVTSGYFMDYSRFIGGQFGSFYFSISGNAQAHWLGHYAKFETMSEAQSADSDPDENIIEIKDNAYLKFAPANNSWSLAADHQGMVTVNMSGGHVDVPRLELGYATGANAHMYLSNGNIHISDYMYFGNNSGDGISIVEVSGTGNLKSTNDIRMYSDLSHLKIVGSSVNIQCGGTFRLEGQGNITFTPDAQGVSTVISNSMTLSSRGTLNVDVAQYGGTKSINLFHYSGSSSQPFASANITNGSTPLTLGSNPSSDANNLNYGEYFLDYGDGTNDYIKLHYKTSLGTLFFIE